jgi:RsiW-degrading membrane proteinase PrsW (M82 family)
MVFPQVIFLILLGLAPSLIWLIFYLQKDLHPEPKKLIALVFLGGAVITPFVALIENYLETLSSQDIGLLLSAALIEELAKLLVFWLLVWKHPAFDEPTDAMIYLITAALGFAAAENILNLFQLGTAELGLYLSLISARFLGATLLHSLASAVLGFYVARFHFKTKTKGQGHTSLIFKGIIYATLFHAAFNFFISQSQAQGNLLALLIVVILLGAGLAVILTEFRRLSPQITLKSSPRKF